MKEYDFGELGPLLLSSHARAINEAASWPVARAFRLPAPGDGIFHREWNWLVVSADAGVVRAQLDDGLQTLTLRRSATGDGLIACDNGSEQDGFAATCRNFARPPGCRQWDLIR